MAIVVPSGTATRRGDQAELDDRARQQHHNAEVGVVEERRPLRVGEEVQSGNLGEKDHALLHEDVDDATVVSTDTNAAKKSSAWMARSLRLRENSSRGARSPWPATRATGAPNADAVSIIGSSRNGTARRGLATPTRRGGATDAALDPAARRRGSHLGFARHQVVDLDADLGHATEHRGLLALGEVLLVQRVGLVGSGTYFTSRASFEPCVM